MHTSPKEVLYYRKRASRATLQLAQRCLRDVTLTPMDARECDTLLRQSESGLDQQQQQQQQEEESNGEINVPLLEQPVEALRDVLLRGFFARAAALPSALAPLARRPLCAVALCLA
jgi:hypothetical protein